MRKLFIKHLLSDMYTNKHNTVFHYLLGTESITANSELFVSILFSRNFANAKFFRNETLPKWRSHYAIY